MLLPGITNLSFPLIETTASQSTVMLTFLEFAKEQCQFLIEFHFFQFSQRKKFGHCGLNIILTKQFKFLKFPVITTETNNNVQEI